MRERPGVVLIDDGELDDVSHALEALGAPTVRIRGEGVESGDAPWPSQLLVATERRAFCLPPLGGERPRGCTAIAVAAHDSQTTRSMLRAMGFDYLVRRPVHPEALRLLMLRGMHGALAKRREPRTALDCEVRWRSGWRSGRAGLVEGSPSGCRLLLHRPLGRGARVRLRLPGSLIGAGSLALHGRVLRCERDLGADPHRPWSVALFFADLPPEARNGVEALLARFAAEAEAEPVEEPVPSPPPRRRPRGTFHSQVFALDEQAERVLHVLDGLDLSEGGIRVEYHPALSPGTRLRLDIYDAGHPEPLQVGAEVLRDDGEQGVALRFVDVDPSTVAELEALVETLPAVEALRPAESDSRGVWMAELHRS